MVGDRGVHRERRRPGVPVSRRTAVGDGDRDHLRLRDRVVSAASTRLRSAVDRHRVGRLAAADVDDQRARRRDAELADVRAVGAHAGHVRAEGVSARALESHLRVDGRLLVHHLDFEVARDAAAGADPDEQVACAGYVHRETADSGRRDEDPNLGEVDSFPVVARPRNGEDLGRRVRVGEIDDRGAEPPAEERVRVAGESVGRILDDAVALGEIRFGVEPRRTPQESHCASTEPTVEPCVMVKRKLRQDQSYARAVRVGDEQPVACQLRRSRERQVKRHRSDVRRSSRKVDVGAVVGVPLPSASMRTRSGSVVDMPETAETSVALSTSGAVSRKRMLTVVPVEDLAVGRRVLPCSRVVQAGAPPDADGALVPGRLELTDLQRAGDVVVDASEVDPGRRSWA